MATTKKPTVKKTVSKSKPSVKAPVKKVVAKTTSAKSVPEMKSFKLSRDTLPFFAVHITRQTIYWSALLIFIMLLQLWILNIQLDIIQITDSTTLQS
jgi:hypothetical protein